jgi:LCP family protein required for cell wall assembly
MSGAKEGNNLNNNESRNTENKKKSRKKPIILSIIGVVLLLLAAGGIYTWQMLGKVQNVKIDKTGEGVGITEDIKSLIQQQDPKNQITNIALFGLDRRSKDEGSRSDAIMIASIDRKHKKIKLSSIMRDTYVSVPGRGKTKITHAYAYGGPQLAIRTLNENFQLDIENYIAVDFFSLEKIIDSIGGVTIDVRAEEIKLINFYMEETSRLEEKGFTPVTKVGTQTLNGMQAVAYTRIRYIGNDQERTERQRKVLEAMFSRIQAAGITRYPALVSTILPYAETSLGKESILSTGAGILTSGIKTVDQMRYPKDGFARGEMINKVYYLVADLKATTQQMHKFIYEDIK